MSKHDVKTYELNKISQAEAQNFGFMNLQIKSDLIPLFFFLNLKEWYLDPQKFVSKDS